MRLARDEGRLRQSSFFSVFEFKATGQFCGCFLGVVAQSHGIFIDAYTINKALKLYGLSPIAGRFDALFQDHRNRLGSWAGSSEVSKEFTDAELDELLDRIPEAEAKA